MLGGSKGEGEEKQKDGKMGRGIKEFFEDRGVRVEEMEKRREEGEDRFEKVVKTEKKKQRVKRWKRIGGSSYNRWYREVKGEEIPEYLKERMGRKKMEKSI